ncbi:putative subunit 2 of mRNA decapping complex [Hamiltosporidium tvaerminnensis]|uniref:Putative subunit 2 of mRNA decapping complex n=1 Tax=Hamiltosporidium tvaerminnensis TaxID=1176355 RepID=A0A4Q9KQL9_9MICR|nr:mRNA-decapping enzyme subunit 2 [Hamiltosporidium tvaerminnensis]TBT96967.1 putative subunit 2 of mRNA decapping complex [Hamiltosporidium tvaerminnensis]TBU20643.1 putative subunit 2 of mRNA decapping complex [Hamiltosporidium tvaerminnensis]
MKFKDALEDLSIRFLYFISEEDLKYTERLFFKIEEAFWHFIDFYSHKTPKLSEKVFAIRIIIYNNLPISNIPEKYKEYIKYKRNIPVFGALILNKDLTHILLVKGMQEGSKYSFPKGKRCFNETPQQCAIREVYEEIGYDISTKITQYTCEIKNDTYKLFVIINVHNSTKFTTKTRNEISDIKWFPINEIQFYDYKEEISFVKTLIPKIKEIVNKIKENHFRFNLSKFHEIFNSLQ